MVNIYKYPLEWTTSQTVKCRGDQILDIQIQNNRPVMWVLEQDDSKEKDITIVLRGTGTAVLDNLDDYFYISTTQCDGFVWHWFEEEHY